MTNSYFIQKNIQELNQIEDMLKQYPPTRNPNAISVEHTILLEEQKKLKNRIERGNHAAGIKNPLINTDNNQSLRVNSTGDTSNDMYNQLKISDDNQQVSPQERQAACAALEPNGCGAKDHWLTPAIPNAPGGFDFTEACNNHDRKYATLGYGFDRANREFLEEMLSVPARELPSGYGGRTIKVTPERATRYYYNWVLGQDAQDAYNKAQKNTYICKHGRKPQ